MTIEIEAPQSLVLKPRITVFGIGGAGGNAVNNMISASLQGANFVVANTDAQALEHSLASVKIQLGETTTKGLGAGAYPDVGKAAAEESMEEIKNHLEGSNMVFITAGMGGGTGTGAAPVIANMARELGILTVGVVTKPFHFEGKHRMKTAEHGLAELQKYVDTLIVIPNQNLFRIANERTTFADAFKMADDVLHAGVRGVTDLMIMPGLINLDFADIRTVMSEMGKAMMGTGEASGEERAILAAEAAIANPLLDNCSMRGAKGVLINITGGMDMTLFEVDAAANRIRDEVGDNGANIIFGSTFNPELDGIMRVSVVATGIDSESYIAELRQHNNARNAASMEERPEITESLDNMVQFSFNEPAEDAEEELNLPEESLDSEEDFMVAEEFERDTRSNSDIYSATRATPEANNSANKSSFFSKMSALWKSPDEPVKERQVEHRAPRAERELEPATASKSEDVYDVPAFLRRKK